MKNIICIILLFSIAKSSAQTLSAKMIAPNEVELTITNSNQEWFFMPYINYNTIDQGYFLFGKKSVYALYYKLYVDDKESACSSIIDFVYSKPTRFDKVGSGYYDFGEIIQQRYKINFSSCEKEELKNENIYIQFVLEQNKIEKMKLFKADFKHRDNIFNGQLYSKKIPLRIK